MRRRRLLVAIPGLVTATAGCNVPSSSQSTPTPDVTNAESEAAFQQLESVFTELDTVDITQVDSLSAMSFREIDVQVLEQNINAAKVSLAEIQQAESTPSTEQRAVIYGINIAQERLAIYEQLERLLTRRARLKELIAAEKYATIVSPTADIVDATDTVISASRSLSQLLTDGLDDITEDDLPGFYPLEIARREATVYTNSGSKLRSTAQMLSAWANSLSEAGAAQALFENRDLKGAQIGFATAVNYVEDAQMHHSSVDAPPALLESLYQNYACGFTALKSAFTAGRSSARAARAGDQEKANSQLLEYKNQFDGYKTECLS